MGQRGGQRPWPQCLTQVRGPFRFRCRFTLSWLQKPRGKSFGLPKCVFEGVAILKLTLQMLSNFPGQPWKPCLRSTSAGLHVSPIFCDRTTGLVICDCTCAPVPANATDIRYLLFYSAPLYCSITSPSVGVSSIRTGACWVRGRARSARMETHDATAH